MKFRFGFLTLISLFHGYILWAGTGIALFWTKRATPISELERGIRWSCLFLVIGLVLATNLILNRRRQFSHLNLILNSVLSASVVYLVGICIAAGLSTVFIPDISYFGFSLYVRAPWALPFELLVLNILGLFVTCISLVVFRLFEFLANRIKSRLP